MISRLGYCLWLLLSYPGCPKFKSHRAVSISTYLPTCPLPEAHCFRSPHRTSWPEVRCDRENPNSGGLVNVRAQGHQGVSRSTLPAPDINVILQYARRSTTSSIRLKDIASHLWLTQQRDLLSILQLSSLQTYSCSGLHSPATQPCWERGAGTWVHSPGSPTGSSWESWLSQLNKHISLAVGDRERKVKTFYRIYLLTWHYIFWRNTR